MAGSSLPPGFRFHPTDEELVSYYLHRRNEKLEIELNIIPSIELYNYDPWELPERSFLPNRDMEWFFFCQRDRKYQNGRAPFGGRTEWVMHEYRLCDNDSSQGSLNFKGDFALCRVLKRNDLTLKKCETNSPEVLNEPLRNRTEISCQESYQENVSSDTSNNTLWTSPDIILESSFQENSQPQTEQDSGFQEFALPEFEYPQEFFADLNFDWEMESPFMFDNYPEAHMNNEVMNYQVFG
ncbi:hypothetical protein AALP_AA1G330000 [Arabis alpina]|uniref:NAC domain-containing protein n=1 Tax=Arabis alpina TaxID=50452 RepID=A0A087HS90_ARAAL|nr:hypothetical protein AALP_AA1G330000 [Arabis alpina]